MKALYKVLLFPLIYLAADLLVRSELLELYSPLQRSFYLLSVINSLLFYFAILIVLKRLKHKKLAYLSILGLVSLYFVASVSGSFIFFYFNGFFPNFYTYEYFKNEPLSAMVLLRDTIKLQDIFIFSFAFIVITFIIHRSVDQVSGRRNRLRWVGGLFFVLISFLIFMIKRYDQCLTVDSNFSAAILRHAIDYRPQRVFKGQGLGLKTPVHLPKLEEKRDYNVLVVVFESLRKQDLPAYGYHRETTPQLNRLRYENPDQFHVFERPYAASSTTMLAVPAILTGMAPYQPEAEFYSQPFLWDYAKMLDYRTFFISSHSMKWYRFDRFYERQKPEHYWYKEKSGKPFFNDLGINDVHTVNEVCRTIERNDERPFFGVVQFNATHYPYNVPTKFKRWKGRFVDEYDNSILYQDHLLGILFSSMKANHLLENTVVVFVSDHGESLKDHNNIGHVDSYYAEAISVPLMFYIPKKIAAKKNMQTFKSNTKKNVCTIDIAPTIVDLLGLSKQKSVKKYVERFEGYNLFSNVPKDRSIITMNNNDVAKFWVGVSVIRGDYHYLHRVNVVPNKEEIYHLKTDRKESKNIVSKIGPRRKKWIQDALYNYEACKKYLKR
jgi:glucan phosphoethanolaminetransferase (alkaline phosphatase superfamily)